MRLRILSLFTILALAAAVAVAQQNFGGSDVPAAPPIGSKMPVLKLATLAGESTGLPSYANKNGLLVIFVSVQ
ncbi:MAG TPA: hypothetical protein VEG63_06285, partial [Candidatus Acidoferrales bacterium]|nr:hypothetical protein [Candidatus Acidoferrales bacterium]